MAKIPAGILGRVSGKVGDVVGAAWKGIPYIRQYVIPGNPNTVAQQAERALFANIVSLAQAALGPILQPYWDPFIRQNSGWARFIGVNRGLVSVVDDFSSVLISRGTLEGAVIISASLGGTDVPILWSATVLGNGSPGDMAGGFVYDRVNKVGFFNGAGTRADTAMDVAVGAGRVAANLDAWLFFADDAADPTKVSFSDYSVVS